MIELDVFEAWLLKKSTEYSHIIATHDVRDEWRNQEKPALAVSLITTDEWLGNITFWNSGEADVYVFDNVGNVIYPVHYVTVSSSAEFDEAFKEFFEKLTTRG